MQLRTTRPKRAPAHLGKAGAKLWRELVDEYQMTDAAGLALSTCAAECLDRMRSAQEAIVKHGEIVTDRCGAPKLNPACTLEKDARNGMIAALKALDLDAGAGNGPLPALPIGRRS